jgi:hypothetical protein
MKEIGTNSLFLETGTDLVPIYCLGTPFIWISGGVEA